MLIVVVLTLYPFLYLVAQSFSSEAAVYNGKVFLFPVDFNTDTYKAVLKTGDFFMTYGNTILYTVTGTILSVFLTAILAYPLAKANLRLNKIIMPLVIFTMYFSGGLIPNYILINSLHMRNTIWAILIPGAISTFYVLLMRAFFQSMPKDLEEAAMIDGLNTYGIFVRIILPLTKPIVATMVLFYAVGIWSNWFGPFIYLDSKKYWPVALYLRQIIMSASSTTDGGADAMDAQQIAATVKACTMVLSSAPIICVYPFVQKYFVQGMMLGSVKG